MNNLDANTLAALAARTSAARLSAAEEWRDKPLVAFEKFIRATPFRQGRGVYADVSVQQHEAEFGKFLDYLASCPPGVNLLTIGADRVSSFLANLEGRDPAQPGTKVPSKRGALNETKERYLNLLDGVFNGLYLAGYRSNNPALEAQQLLKNPRKEPPAGIIFLSAEEDERFADYLLNTHEVSTWRERRRRAMLLFMHGTGVECSVARRATVEDFVLNDHVPGFDVRLPRSGSFVANYRVPLAPFCIEPVLAWVKERQAYLDSVGCKDATGERLAFPRSETGEMLTNSGLWRGAAPCLKAIGFKGGDVGGRVLRNTFIRRQILAGKSNGAIQDLVGLSSDTTVRRLRSMSLQHREAEPV